MLVIALTLRLQRSWSVGLVLPNFDDDQSHHRRRAGARAPTPPRSQMDLRDKKFAHKRLKSQPDLNRSPLGDTADVIFWETFSLRPSAGAGVFRIGLHLILTLSDTSRVQRDAFKKSATM